MTLLKIATIFGCVITIASGPAYAGTTAIYNMTGSVASLCTAGSGGSLVFGTLTNAATGATQVQTSNPSFSDSTAFCNQAKTTVMVQRTNLTSSASTSSGFTNILPITSVTVSTPQNIAGITDTSVITTATSPGTSGTIGAFSALKVSALAGNTGSQFLVANSNYSGAITITLTPTN